MQASPTLTIDSAGTAFWNAPLTPPASWGLFAYFDDGTYAQDISYIGAPGPTDSVWDAHANGVPGGLRIGLVGFDADGNIITQPVPSLGNLTALQ